MGWVGHISSELDQDGFHGHFSGPVCEAGELSWVNLWLKLAPRVLKSWQIGSMNLLVRSLG